jgi:hypothetical protein
MEAATMVAYRKYFLACVAILPICVSIAYRIKQRTRADNDSKKILFLLYISENTKLIAFSHENAAYAVLIWERRRLLQRQPKRRTHPRTRRPIQRKRPRTSRRTIRKTLPRTIQKRKVWCVIEVICKGKLAETW